MKNIIEADTLEEALDMFKEQVLKDAAESKDWSDGPGDEDNIKNRFSIAGIKNKKFDTLDEAIKAAEAYKEKALDKSEGNPIIISINETVAKLFVKENTSALEKY